MASVDRIEVSFDHVGIATPQRGIGWPLLRAVLGGAWYEGGETPNFGWHQLEYRNGVKVELLHPLSDADDPFLQDFLDRHGAGVHHVTFHVSSVPDLMAAATAADFPIVSFDTEDDYWHEAFVDPRATQGILVQLGSLVGEEPTPLVPSDAPAAVCPTATFTRSTHAVRNLDRALDFFSGVLNGTVDCPDRGVADVTWARDHRLRLVEGANLERKGAAQLSFELGDLRAGGVRRAWSTELGVDVVVDIESGLLDAVVGEMKRSAVT